MPTVPVHVETFGVGIIKVNDRIGPDLPGD